MAVIKACLRTSHPTQKRVHCVGTILLHKSHTCKDKEHPGYEQAKQSIKSEQSIEGQSIEGQSWSRRFADAPTCASPLPSAFYSLFPKNLYSHKCVAGSTHVTGRAIEAGIRDEIFSLTCGKIETLSWPFHH
eukprot:1149741-Pelagomonas_calceolata.AAC.6